MKKFAIIVAGGSGTRMGAGIPKQFLKLGNKAILQISIEKFLEAEGPDISIVTVLPKDHIQTWKDYCYDNAFTLRQTLVQGGFTRFHSVKNALAKIPSGSLVAVHDAVRPLVSPELINRLYEIAEAKGSAVPAVPCADTIRCLQPSDDCTLEAITGRSLTRNELFAVQTPQVFISDILKKAYGLPYDTSFTDDASVVEASGTKVFYSSGEKNNLKITTPEDMALARALLGNNQQETGLNSF